MLQSQLNSTLLNTYAVAGLLSILLLGGASPLRAQAPQAPLKDIWPGLQSSSPMHLFKSTNGTLFFTAEDSAYGRELWKSDGTEEGTVLVKDISPHRNGSIASSSRPRSFVNYKEHVYFAAYDSTHGEELWKSDGTEDGTVLVKDVLPGTAGRVFDLAVVGDLLYFTAPDSALGNTLWKSDGTEEGTVLVKDIDPSSENFLPSHLINADGTLFLLASDGVHGRELWKSDGTEEGTVLVKDIRSGSQGINFHQILNVNDTVFLLADDGVHGFQIWKSDGTEEGTVLVKEIGPANGEFGDCCSDLVQGDSLLFFFGPGGIWKSDGTEEGTVLLTALEQAGLTEWAFLTYFEGHFYFYGFEAATGWELWKSDGTVEGTALIRDNTPGPNINVAVGEMVFGGGLLFFSYQRRVWVTDGTEAGTRQLIDSPFYGGEPHNLTYIDGTLFFVIRDIIVGEELRTLSDLPVGTEEEHPLPDTYALSAAYPNPFNATTEITLSLPQPQHVDIALYDMLGRRVQRIYEGWLLGGTSHSFTVDGTALPNGLYLIRLQGDHFQASRATMLLK